MANPESKPIQIADVVARLSEKRQCLQVRATRMLGSVQMAGNISSVQWDITNLAGLLTDRRDTPAEDSEGVC